MRILLLLALLFATPAFAASSVDAHHALPYLLHDNDVTDDIAAMDARYRPSVQQQFDDVYVQEFIRQQRMVGARGSRDLIRAVGDLAPPDRAIYNQQHNEFVERLDDDIKKLSTRVLASEWQAHKIRLSNDDIVAAKEFYLKQPHYFEMLPSFSSYARLAEPVTLNEVFDTPARLPLAESVAAALAFPDKPYASISVDLDLPQPMLVNENLRNTLHNTFNVNELQAMADFAASDAGQHYVALKNDLFVKRYASLTDAYRLQLAKTETLLRKRITPQYLYYDYRPIRVRPILVPVYPVYPQPSGPNIHIEIK